MARISTVTYQFKFSDGSSRTLAVRVRMPAMELIPEPMDDAPEWIDLVFEQCPNCTLDPVEHRWCPAARGLTGVNEAFRDRVSHDTVEVVVHDEARSYSKTCPLQEGVSSLMGLIMATSGCPHLAKLRPMAFTHMPFATPEQTFYRVTSMYLLAQFMRERQGQTPDWSMRDLSLAIGEARAVNSAFARRLRECQTMDANLNAIVKLDCQVDMASFLIEEDQWEDFENLFRAYYPERQPVGAGDAKD